jgi:hypothetical protein
MNIKSHNSEKGQAIVYLVIGLVVFLGFVALAIDGSMALADRRNDQNAADAASLAGGGVAADDLQRKGVQLQDWSCSSSNPIYAKIYDAMVLAENTAKSRALANYFTIYKPTDPEYDPIDHNNADATCGDKYIDVTVEISATTPSNFLQLIFPNALHNETEAVTRINPGYPAGFGNAIVALNPDPCNGNQNGGIFSTSKKAVVDIKDGGIFSNGCLREDGSPTIDITGGLPWYHIECENCDPKSWTPYPQYTPLTVQPSDFDIPGPINCTYTKNDPGKFSKEIADTIKKDGSYTFLPGLWCINGHKPNDTFSFNANDIIFGTGVTFYITNADLTINGSADLSKEGYHLSAPLPDASSGIPGVLIYLVPPDPIDSASCPNHTVTINGTSKSYLAGQILAPCSLIKINGTGDNTYLGQVIGWNVEVGGTATLDLTYKGNDLFNKPTSMELYR